jgi:hypothetical protein
MSSLQRGNVTPPVNFPIDAYATSAATTLNVSARTIVKASPGRLVRVESQFAGTTVGPGQMGNFGVGASP